jgi:hypothetical protein
MDRRVEGRALIAGQSLGSRPGLPSAIRAKASETPDAPIPLH